MGLMKKCIDFNEKVYRTRKVLYTFEALKAQIDLDRCQLPNAQQSR
jgi:hypothetical protein